MVATQAHCCGVSRCAPYRVPTCRARRTARQPGPRRFVALDAVSQTFVCRYGETASSQFVSAHFGKHNLVSQLVSVSTCHEDPFLRQ